MPPPFLGTAVVGSGGTAAAIDAYGDVVDLRAPGPAGRALVDNPADRQAAGSVDADTGIVPRISIDRGAARPLWRADAVAQHYQQGTNVVRTVARFGQIRIVVTDAAVGGRLARLAEVTAPGGVRALPRFTVRLSEPAGCARQRTGASEALVCALGEQRGAGGGAAVAVGGGGAVAAVEASRLLATARRNDRRWLSRAQGLGSAAPSWAREMYHRSLLTLRALTDGETGAVAAGARDGWAYVWPRDAGAAALAFAAAGYRVEARQVARFLLRLDLDAAARFDGEAAPVAGREAQGDAAGWVAVAARTTGLAAPPETLPWSNRPDYQESAPGTFLANAIAAGLNPPVDGPEIRLYGGKSAHQQEAREITGAFGGPGRLVRRAGDPDSGLDSAAAWAVRPFPQPALFPVVRRTLLQLAGEQTRFGITPGEAWPGIDPWTAPTAWTAWSLAALGERRAALRLLAGLRRAATPAGALPERVDARTGIPTSTTPLAWSHAFAILALRELWP
jgi:hypothetical protein